MKTADHHLNRLLQAAADTPAPAATEPSFAHKARALAHWRAARARSAWFECLPLFRCGLAVALAAGAVLALVSFTQLKPGPPDAWDFAGVVANAACNP